MFAKILIANRGEIALRVIRACREMGIASVAVYSDADAPEGRKVAEELGYPVLLKAAAGGGGKGMREVREASQLESALASAQREAKNAFGDDAVYVEKLILAPRHVEIQVLGDTHGTML